MRMSPYAFICFLGLFAFAGCIKEEDKVTLAGMYTASQKNTSGCADHDDNVSEPRICTAMDCTTLTLSNDGTFSVVEIKNGIASSIGGTYVAETNQITFSWSVGGVAKVDHAAFSLFGSQLIMTYDHDSEGCIKVETFIRK